MISWLFRRQPRRERQHREEDVTHTQIDTHRHTNTQQQVSVNVPCQPTTRVCFHRMTLLDLLNRSRRQLCSFLWQSRWPLSPKWRPPAPPNLTFWQKKKNMSPMSVFLFCDCKMDLTACWCYNIVVMVTKLVPLTTRRPTSSSRFMFFKVKARTTFFFYLWHSDENITPFPHTEYDMWLFQR